MERRHRKEGGIGKKEALARRRHLQQGGVSDKEALKDIFYNNAMRALEGA